MTDWAADLSADELDDFCRWLTDAAAALAERVPPASVPIRPIPVRPKR